MKTLGYFTKEDTVQLLNLFKKEGVDAGLSSDEVFSKRYKKTFSINPSLRRKFFQSVSDGMVSYL